MPDALFSHPRLAAIYDTLDGERDDLDHYEAMVAEFDARSVLDVGCGTGSFAVRLAQRTGRRVERIVGVDPAQASIEIAQTKPGAERVEWHTGLVEAVPAGNLFDLAVMTGNVAQVFIDDEDWDVTLTAVRSRLRDGGRFVFETRDPAAKAWLAWADRKPGTISVDGEDIGVEFELSEVALPVVSFRWSFAFPDGIVIASDSTLRFRTLEELHATLGAAGFSVDHVRDAPDRPGFEWVVVAHAV